MTEIDKAQLSPGEEEELEAARRRLDGAEILLGSVEKVRALLYGNGAAKESAYDSVSQALADIRTMLKYDDSVTPMAETLEQMLYQIEECAAELRHYGEGMTLDPKQVEETENRLQLIRQLKRKYGGSIKEILAFRQEAAASLEELQFKNENKDFLRREAGNMEQHYTKLAQKISDLRHQGGETLAKHLGALWEDLGMEDTKFRVQIDQVLPGPDGRDTIEFIISPNPGEELKPLARIASGGEMSRIMLALKTVLAEIDQVPTLIFDEIDAGIGGETIGRVAEKLAAIGKHRQVLCVTHSPRIAAKARKHFAIKKQIASGRTITNISALKEEQRIAELTRMLGGNDLLTTQHAKNLLKK